MNKFIFGVSAALCFALVSSCATGRYVVSYGNFAPIHEVEWDWEFDPPMFTVRLKASAGNIGAADPERYKFTVTASDGKVIPSETISNEGGLPDLDTRGTHLRWVETVFVRLAEMPPDTDFPVKLSISMGGTVIETFNVKLR
jgi:hypothetical protein